MVENGSRMLQCRFNLGHTAYYYYYYYYVYLSFIICNLKGLHRRYVCSCERVNIHNTD